MSYRFGTFKPSIYALARQKVLFRFRFSANLNTPPTGKPRDEGQVLAWVYMYENWYGPFSVNLPTTRGVMDHNQVNPVGPDQWAIKRLIYERKGEIEDALTPLYGLTELPTPQQVQSIIHALYPGHEKPTFC